VWISVHYFGVDALRAAIDRSLDLARQAQALIEASDRLELLNPAELSVVCFRRQFPGVSDEDEVAGLNAALVDQLNGDGRALISSTRLHGRYALRLCVLNHTSTAADVRQVIDWIEHALIPQEASRQDRFSSQNRDPDVGNQLWLERRTVDSGELGTHAIFQSLTEQDLAFVAESAWERTVEAGETIVQQWEPSREFYVVLEGTAEARAGERVLNELGPGEFFGELAARDWGAGFGYPRLASVIARTPMRLLVLPYTRFNALVRRVPAFSHQIERAVRERLPRV
jgi:aromatic-L-amino-acid/L-tryptophan decarboxylase